MTPRRSVCYPLIAHHRLHASNEPREESVQRVVVTGLGAITPVGLSYEESWCNLRAGVSGVDRLTTVDPEGLDVQIAAEAKNFDPRDFMDFKAARRMDRFAQLAVAAAGQALRDADLEITSQESERIGVMLNTGGGGIQTLSREALHYHEGGPARVSPFTIPMITPNMAACQVSITYGIHGPVMASVAACAAGTQAFIGARLYCEIIGGALTADAFHISLPPPNGTGAARAMCLALANANVAPREIDYICAHGTATPYNDSAETAAIKAAFGDEAYHVPISSPKSMIGHLFGAAGAI